MDRLYERIKSMDPSRLNTLLTVIGIILGLLMWAGLRYGMISGVTYLLWVTLGVFLLLMLFLRAIRINTGVNLTRFRFSMAGTLIVCLVVYIAVYVITSIQAGTPVFGEGSEGKGLIELLLKM